MTDEFVSDSKGRQASTSPTRVRATLLRHPKLVAAAVVTVVLAVGAFLTWFYWPEPRLVAPSRAWYTVDDGDTRFDDDAERIPPFDHDGKPAVRLHLYSCDGGKTTFVGYLQKLPEETLQKYRDKGVDPASIDDDELAGDGGWLAKRPGPGNWVNSQSDPDAFRVVVSVRCPDGETKSSEEVFPPEPTKR